MNTLEALYMNKAILELYEEYCPAVKMTSRQKAETIEEIDSEIIKEIAKINKFEDEYVSWVCESISYAFHIENNNKENSDKISSPTFKFRSYGDFSNMDEILDSGIPGVQKMCECIDFVRQSVDRDKYERQTDNVPIIIVRKTFPERRTTVFEVNAENYFDKAKHILDELQKSAKKIKNKYSKLEPQEIEIPY